LAQCADRIFSDDKFARAISRAERTLVQQRGDEKANVDRLLDIYAQIIKGTAAAS
jgi:hypothetical protein